MTSVVWAASDRDRLLDGGQVNVVLPEWLPQWWKCSHCRNRSLFGHPQCACYIAGHEAEIDGPLPVTVYLWREINPTGFPEDVFGGVDVKVTLDGHHADKCYINADPLYPHLDNATYCTPDALPDCWHVTATEVVQIEPVKIERPCVHAVSQGACNDCNPFRPEPAVWWRCDVDGRTC